jgi:hypothetical protein
MHLEASISFGEKMATEIFSLRVRGVTSIDEARERHTISSRSAGVAVQKSASLSPQIRHADF